MTWLSSICLASMLTIVELNCENAFDCRHDSLKHDEEWVIGGARRWSHTRYWRKLNDIGKAILHCGEWNSQWTLPDIVALVEVENDTVLRDLTQRSLLRRAGYEYIITQSADWRGVDVALLYSPFSFLLLNWYAIRPPTLEGQRPTRDILYAKGLTIDDDTLHLFVVHAPSRYGGEFTTRPYRVAVAERIGSAVDSIYAVNEDARIVVMGDFNDYTGDQALNILATHRLDHVSKDAEGTHGAKATYRYQGLWQSLDHFFVSRAVGACVVGCEVADPPFLLESDPTYGGVRPKRTYSGYKYHKGTSDHLPLVLRLQLD